MTRKTTQIGLLGFGTVGQKVYTLIDKNREFICQKMQTDILIKKICVRDLKKNRGGVDKNLFTTDYKAIATDPDISIVVELMGDNPQALEAIRLALKHGNSVVTANKALIARHALELFKLAKENGCEILFEASVAAGIPILRALREGLSANRILSLRGIINGTANFILTKMTEEGADFDTALAEAKRLGFAEADERSDVDGIDAAYKLAILAMICHGTVVTVEDIFCKGIRYIKPLDIEMAEKFGYVIKLLGICKMTDGLFEARVHPAMVSKHNPLSHINGVANAIQLCGDFVGEGMLTGLGAGGAPTASAVVADIIELNRNIQSRNEINLEPTGFLPEFLKETKPADILDLQTCYYIRFSVLDKPHVLAHVTTILGKNNISVQHLYQHGEKEEQSIPIIVFTHVARERDVRAALKEIDSLDFVTQTTKIIRIEE